MKRPFQKGDRVRVYASVYEELLETVGTIERILENGMVYVEFDKVSEIGNASCWAHPRQCRRLVKKERRRVWIPEGALDRLYSGDARNISANISDRKIVDTDTQFVEVRRKK